MADTFKSLGQSIPVAATLTDLYTVPAVTSTVGSSLVACNTGDTEARIRVSHAIAGAADTAAQYLWYDLPLAAHDTFAPTLGPTFATTDVIRVQSDTGLVAFNLYGTQVT